MKLSHMRREIRRDEGKKHGNRSSLS